MRSVLPGGLPMNMFSSICSVTAGGARVADVVGAVLTLADLTERHVGADDLQFGAVRILDDVQCHMGIAGLDVIVEFDVVELGAADDAFLLGDRQRLPRPHVVDVLLHVHITAAGEVRILIADLAGGQGDLAVRVLGAVDEAEQIAVVEELEAVHLVDDRDGTGHRLGDPAGQLETDVENLGADVEEQIPRGGRGVVAGAAQLDEGMQLGGPRPGEQSIPGVGADRGHQRQVLGRITEADRPNQAGKLTQRVVDDGLTTGLDRGHQEDGRRRQRRENRLRLRGGHRSTLMAAPSDMMVNMSTGASAHGLCEFIDASPSPFHVCQTAARRLTAAGYTELAETDRWPDRRGRYFTVRAGSLVAWDSSGDPDRPFRIVGGHTDSPNLRVKQHPDRVVAGWQVVALEPYGGAWLNSWLDRDLGASGRLSVRDPDAEGGVSHLLVLIDEPILRVPQLAIHLAEDRGAVKLDPQRHVNAVWGLGTTRARSSTTPPSGPVWTRPTCCRPI